MKTVSKILAGAIIALLPLSAVGHPGHGDNNPLSPGHYINSPEHALPITLMIAVMAVLFTWLINRKKRTMR